LARFGFAKKNKVIAASLSPRLAQQLTVEAGA